MIGWVALAQFALGAAAIVGAWALGWLLARAVSKLPL